MRLVRGALVALLANEPNIEVVGEVGWGQGIVAVSAELRPHVVVINTDRMVSQMVPAVSELQEAAGQCAVLILADPRKAVILPPGRRTRSLSFLVKDAPPALLGESIRRMAAGERVIDPQIAVAALTGADNLTNRELEVLSIAAEGASVPEIARRLYLSLGTVRNYLSAATAKTGARNRIDAIRIARQSGWLL
jgi:two-component system response regulator DesR